MCMHSKDQRARWDYAKVAHVKPCCVIWWLLVTFILWILLLVLLAQSHSSPDRPCPFLKEKQTFAHRGYLDNFQENTIGAGLESYTHGYAPEFDIWMTKDQEMVVWHDDDCKRMAGSSDKIAEMTLSEVRALTLKTKIGDKQYNASRAMKVDTYAEYLESMCGTMPAANFVVDLNFADNPPFLSDRDELQAIKAVEILHDSSCRSGDVIFTIGHPGQGPVIRDTLKKYGMNNPITFWMVPDSWPLGELFWIKSRFLFVAAQVDGVEFHHLLWDAHKDAILPLVESDWCVGAFGFKADPYSDDVQMLTLDVPQAAWEAMGDQKYKTPLTYGGDAGGAYEGFMFLVVALSFLLLYLGIKAIETISRKSVSIYRMKVGIATGGTG